MTRQPNQISMQTTKSTIRVFLVLFFFCFGMSRVMAQTSWKGTTSTSWSTASNWTNGVPTAAVDAIIGDASFTGNFQPGLTVQSSCKSLTIGSGAKASMLFVDKAFTIAGNLVIGANGTINQSNTSLSLKGNWTNSGTYSASHVSSTVIMAGTTQTITGTATFRKLTINAGSTTTLNNSIVVNKGFTVSGVLDPQTFLITLTGSSFAVSPGATIKVGASTFAGNYSVNPTLGAESTVDYASTSISQTVATLSYSTLKISGSTTKILAANTTLMSSTGAVGNVNVTAGTLDLSGKTLNRGTSVVGGSITLANGAYLKIGGTASFPANFASSNLAIASTVEYNGTNQTVSNQPYGNLILSSSSGSATKTMPGTAMTIANDFTSSIGSGSSVSFTAGANITVNGNLSIGTSTTFGGAAYSHTIAGNWINNGIFTAGTSTVIMSGTNKMISGASTSTFHNLSITGLGISTSSTALTVAGNLSTSGAGVFSHTGGTLTMSGSSKSISGVDITLNNLTVSGSIGTTSSMIVSGNLLVNGSLNATGGTINMSGTSKTISGAGTIIFYSLRIVGTVSTANNFSIVSDMSGSGKLTATGGTATFTGTSTYAGTHDLFNVTLNGTKLQLGANSMLGIANTLALTAGTFDVTTSVPNTVSFNGSGNQNIPSTSYDNLTTATGGIKTVSGALTINNGFTISGGTTFTAGSYTHTIKGNWVNSGTFNSGTSTIQLTGNNDSSITGTTTFNVLTINKSNSSHYVTLNNSISVPTLNMTTGELRTGANSVTITNTRTGSGLILGTITRTHAFSSLVAYAFESSYNTITLASLVGSVTSITVTVHSASVDDFPLDGSINRIYNLSVTHTGSYLATLRLHYEDDELNGNSESTMMLWRYAGTWTNSGKSASSTTNNYIENTLISDISGRWTISDNNTIAVWKGTTSTDWETASNWKSGSVPTATAIVQIGSEAFNYQPTVASSASVKALTFGSVQAATLTLSSGGTLAVSGNVRGDWAGNAAHVINVGSQTLTIAGDLVLSNGTTNRLINLNIGTGTVTVGGSLTQTGSAAIVFSGAGTLNIVESFDYTSGTFTAGMGTVVYNG
jgi:fibronectin-binding autotransporter adhesin